MAMGYEWENHGQIHCNLPVIYPEPIYMVFHPQSPWHRALAHLFFFSRKRYEQSLGCRFRRKLHWSTGGLNGDFLNVPGPTKLTVIQIFIITLWLICYSLLLKIAIYTGFVHWTWWFSIVMLSLPDGILGKMMILPRKMLGYVPVCLSFNSAACCCASRESPECGQSNEKQCHILYSIYTMWGPLVISWFIAPSNYGYSYHKP